MKIDLLLKIKSDKKMHTYLREHSYWYRLLNRDSKNYSIFLKEYKQYRKEVSMNKVNSTIENVEMFSNLIKFVD